MNVASIVRTMKIPHKDHLKTFKSFKDNVVTHSGAHYLMVILELHQHQGYARLSDVAEKLGVTLGSLSTSIRPLIKKKLILQDKNKHLNLSEEGKSIAEQIENTCEVLTYFFHQILGIEKDIAEHDACKIEHLLSPESTMGLLKLIQVLNTQESLTTRIQNAKSCTPKNCPMCSGNDHCMKKGMEG